MKDITENLLSRAYQMYFGKPFDGVENPFPMYSFDTPARSFWRGFIDKLVELGATEEEAEKILRSKHTRWLFDQMEEQLEEFAKGFATEDLINWARDN